ncbi:hypothetical protein DV736_g1464, partial [Chaetothyriales sp. CBS 134916]
MGNSHGKPVVLSDEVNLSHFRLLRVVGKGAFGKVRIVERKDSGLTFALKYIRKDEIVRSESVRNIIRERRMMEHLNHPFLCNLRYSFQDIEYLYLVIDLMAGGDLRFHIQRKAFTEECVRFWMAEIACALRYIHSQGIVHRDLKPDNVLLDSQGHVHLADFNVASDFTPSKLLTSRSGTLAYLAPEVFMGRGYLNEVDWWSAGVTFFECIYGKRPFDGRSQEDLAEKVIAAKPKYYVTRPPVSMPCLSAMQCLMERDRRKRIGATGFETFTNHPFFQCIDFEALEQKQMRPVFVPSSEKTNFDATYDLEELLLEEAPLEARARKQKPRAELRDDATSREIREDELHRMIERMFEPFDYTRASYDVQAAEAVQAVAQEAPPEFLEQTMTKSQNHSSPTSPAASPPLPPVTETADKANEKVPPLDEAHTAQPQSQAATRQVSKSGGVQMVLEEGGSWSNLADHNPTLLTTVAGVEASPKSDKGGSMLGFLSRKNRRERSPKPSESGLSRPLLHAFLASTTPSFGHAHGAAHRREALYLYGWQLPYSYHPSPHQHHPHPPSRMATVSRRAPLKAIPNAANSPHHLLTTSGSKRSRAQANVPQQQENEPPSKRQATEKITLNSGPSTPSCRTAMHQGEGRVFERGTGTSGSTAFQNKLVAAREKGTGLRVTKHAATAVAADDKEAAIRQWQKHHRRLFPSFRFYFDSVGDDARHRLMRQISQLGGHEEKFFSKSVTHIITTREIPPEQSHAGNASAAEQQLQTINPSLLDKNAALASARGQTARRDLSNNLDILLRGRQMEMKVWTLEKLQRILTTILEGSVPQEQNARFAGSATRGTKQDLSHVLRHGKLGISSERESLALLQDLHLFKGPFIYVHDMNEKYRPTMVREYARVTKRTDGEWPQFRSATMGKCPFIEDPAMKKQMEHERRTTWQTRQRKEAEQATRTRPTLQKDAARMDPPKRVSPRKALRAVHNPPPPPTTINPGMLTRVSSTSKDSHFSFPPMPERATVDFVKPSQLQMAREPAASGLQKSNITSAIQSQVISSTAATGLKAGTSREVHELKRKVLERTHTGSLSNGSVPSSHRMTDLAGTLKDARAPAPQRAAKSKAQEKLGGVPEEPDSHADDLAAEKAMQQPAKKKKTPVAKDPKPGYCENCRDKYNDFEEHVVSRKHRKFAMTDSNWIELDALLAKLQKP